MKLTGLLQISGWVRALALIALPPMTWAEVPAFNATAFSNGAGSSNFTATGFGALLAGVLCVVGLMLFGWYVLAGHESWAKGQSDPMGLVWLGFRAIAALTFLFWMATL